MSASQQARNKALAATLDKERHEFTQREMALCREIERLRKLCIEAALSKRYDAHPATGDGCKCLRCRLYAAGRGEGEK